MSKFLELSHDSARDDKLILVPETEVMIIKYREDWNKMEDMFYGSEFPYSYEELLEKVKLVEDEINKNYSRNNVEATDNPKDSFNDKG